MLSDGSHGQKHIPSAWCGMCVREHVLVYRGGVVHAGKNLRENCAVGRGLPAAPFSHNTFCLWLLIHFLSKSWQVVTHSCGLPWRACASLGTEGAAQASNPYSAMKITAKPNCPSRASPSQGQAAPLSFGGEGRKQRNGRRP